MAIVVEPRRASRRPMSGRSRSGYRRRSRSFRRRFLRRVLLRSLFCTALTAEWLVIAPLVGAFVYLACGAYLSRYAFRRANCIRIEAARDIAEAWGAMLLLWPVQSARLLRQLRVAPPPAAAPAPARPVLARHYRREADIA